MTEEGIHIYPAKSGKDATKPFGVHFDVFPGTVPLSSLSLGYQTTLGWTLDLAWRLFEHYPESENPLLEPAIVLIDELDLHLHPEWQRRIMDDLSRVFPEIQFIATSHSPLLVQSKPKANFAILKKIENELTKEIVIENDPEQVKGWRVDQILNSEYFGVTVSRPPEIEDLFNKRDTLLLNSNRSNVDENELRRLQKEISSLPTETDPIDDAAMELIRKAAELLKLKDDSSN